MPRPWWLGGPNNPPGPVQFRCAAACISLQKNKGLFEVKEVLGESNKWSGTQTLITVKGSELFRMMRLGA